MELGHVVTAIAAESKKSDKMAMLGCALDELPQFKDYLKLAFDPYLTFGVSEATLKRRYESGEMDSWTPEMVQFFYDLGAGKYTPTEAGKVIRDMMPMLTSQLQVVTINMLNKTPRIGISGDTLLKGYPGLKLWEPFSLPLAYPRDGKHDVFPCIIQPKIDGLRCKVKGLTAYTRKGHVIHGLNLVLNSIKQIRTELGISDVDFDGEIVAPGQNFDEISGKIRSFAAVPDAHYYIFDYSTSEDGETLEQRSVTLNTWRLMMETMGIQNVSVVDTRMCLDEKELAERFKEYRNWGFEGLMVKNPLSKYYTGRKWHWQKMKPYDTIDCKVIQVLEGEGKFSGVTGSLVALTPMGAEIRVGSGMTDAQRREWFANNAIILGKTIEVGYMESSSKNKLRHPRLIQVRGDK